MPNFGYNTWSLDGQSGCGAGPTTPILCTRNLFLSNGEPAHGRAPPQETVDIRTVQELLGHKDVKTTMSRRHSYGIYTHVLNRGGLAVRSPLD